MWDLRAERAGISEISGFLRFENSAICEFALNNNEPLKRTLSRNWISLLWDQIWPKFAPLRGNFCFAPSYQSWLINLNDSMDIILSFAANSQDIYALISILGVFLGLRLLLLPQKRAFKPLAENLADNPSRAFRQWEACIENWSIQIA